MSRNATTEQRAELLDKLVEPAQVVVTTVAAEVEHHPGLAPPNIPRPSWYKGDRAAFQSSTQAATDLGVRR